MKREEFAFLFCANLQGLTLTAAHTVVFAELYWVPGYLVTSMNSTRTP